MIIRWCFLLILGGLISCGHLQTPEYTSPGEYATPDEYMNSKEIHRDEAQPPRGPFRLRFPVEKMSVSRGYLPRGRKEHHGLDLRGRKNDPIYAAHDGTVIYAGSGFRGYGKMIIIEYDQTWATLYGHLNKFAVKTGDLVQGGQLIGHMGRTGRATGVHLHFELLKEKLPIDPLPIFSAQGVYVLNY